MPGERVKVPVGAAGVPPQVQTVAALADDAAGARASAPAAETASAQRRTRDRKVIASYQ
jgi:hypothetical protein